MTQRYAHLNLDRIQRIAKLTLRRREAEVLVIALERNG
jgi:hypothetical protein